MKINKVNSFTMIEITIVLFVVSFLLVTITFSLNIISSSYLSNAVNLTAQMRLTDDDSLVLWLETSYMTKRMKDKASVTQWLDLSKGNALFVPSSTAPIFYKKSAFPGVGSVYFKGSSSMQSVKALNLSKYTSFVVAASNTSTTQRVYDSGFMLTTAELGSNKIVVVKNDGTTKSIKRGNKASFVTITNSDVLNNRPIVIHLGNASFVGEIFEIIIFDRILSDKEVLNIEDYLFNKYTR